MIGQMISSLYTRFNLPSLNSLSFVELGQILILVLMMLIVYFKLIKNTAAEKLVNGIFLALSSLWILSELLNYLDFYILSIFIKGLIVTVILSLVVIFQPELRRFMGYIGQKNFFNTYFHKKIIKDAGINPLKELLESVKLLKKTKTGALIVIQSKNSAVTYTEVGTKLNAIVSAPLLLTIFHPNTPLHDGAVILQEDTVVAAGVLLPLTESPQLSWKYGTRHRAAIGMSEVCDCACLVVSEETGEVSIALGGTLKKYDDFAILKADLESLMGYNEVQSTQTNIIDFFVKKNKSENK